MPGSDLSYQIIGCAIAWGLAIVGTLIILKICDMTVGLRITRDAQVIDSDSNPIPGLYAAGELVGGLFYFNYPGGTGLMSGAVFGKIAGTSAAKR